MQTQNHLPDDPQAVLEAHLENEYKWGFEVPLEEELAPKGLSEDIIEYIWQKKSEPPFMLDFRMRAYRAWKTMKEPHWLNGHYDPIDYQDAYYYASPKALSEKQPKSLDEIDPEIKRMFERLGIPLEEQAILAGVAVDAVLDSVSVATTYKERLAKMGIIFCSMSEALQNHPDLVKKYLGTVVPYNDNFFAALNSAVFSDGSFVYIPKGVRCPLELSTYFRINARKTGAV